MSDFNANAALGRLMNAAKDEEFARIAAKPPIVSTALSVLSVQQDIAALDIRRKELNDRKRQLARSVAARDERATEQFSAILAELSALDLDEDALKTALESLKEDERREKLRANASEIDEHRRRAGELAAQIVEKSGEFEAALDQAFLLLAEIDKAERSMVSELIAGKIGRGGAASVTSYADYRLHARLSGRPPQWSDPTDKRAEICLSGFRNLPSILDGLDD